jgi:hypothetical protein
VSHASVALVGFVLLLAALRSQPLAAAAPYELTFGTYGQFVFFRWQGTGTSWLLEAGSAPGLSDLARVPITTTTRLSFSASNVPPGTYYVRVRSLSGGVPSAPSNEVMVQVFCTIGELDLRSTKSGLHVQFDWSAIGVVPSIQLEVGTAPGMTNLAVVPLPTFPGRLIAAGPPGTYYVRVRGRSGCGAGKPSNEVRLDLGSPASCVPTLSPYNRNVTYSGMYSASVSVPSGCAWTAFTRDTGWIEPLTVSGVGSRTIFYRVTLPGGGTGQIYVTTSSGRYFVNVTS